VIGSDHLPGALGTEPLERRLRVGLFGGAFDPPHKMHVQLALAAIEQLTLEVLHIVPTGVAWHKSGVHTPALHRLRMTELAFEEVVRMGALEGCQVLIDEREVQSPGPSYTIDTLQSLQAQYPAAEFFVVIGEDQAQKFQTWKNHDEIRRMAHLVVAKRPGVAHQWHNEALGAFIALRCGPFELSATQVREAIAQGQDVSSLIPDSVRGYIQQQGLYQFTS
jgi:nicotinate-nucleotide adenylyltransferase